MTVDTDQPGREDMAHSSTAIAASDGVGKPGALTKSAAVRVDADNEIRQLPVET